MTPDGTNYPIQDHSVLFWGLYLGGIMLFTIALLGVFLIMVARNSQATRRALPAADEVTPLEPVQSAPCALDEPHAA